MEETEYVECESQQENDPAAPFEEVRKTVILKDLQNIANKNRKNRVVDTNALVEEMKKVDSKIISNMKFMLHQPWIFCIHINPTVGLICMQNIQS